MTTRTLVKALFYAISTLILFGCTTSAPESVVKIGSTLDLTGPNASYGQQVQQGMELAVDEINAAGGIAGKKINLTVLDSKSDPKLAVTNAQQLIAAQGTKFLIGEISSSATQAMLPVVEQNSAFLFAPASSSSKLTGISKSFARNWPSDVAEAGSAAEFARRQFGCATAAIAFVNSDYGIGLKDKFTQVYESIGGRLVSSEGYPVAASDFRTLFLKMKLSTPECIYLAGNPKEMGAAVKQLRQANVADKIISNSGFLQPDCLSVAGADAEGVVVPTPNYDPGQSKIPTVSNFANRFRSKYNNDPTISNANAYDAIYLIKEAIEKNGDGVSKVAEYIRDKKNFAGAAGVVSFTDGDVQSEIVFKEVRKGKPVIYTLK